MHDPKETSNCIGGEEQELLKKQLRSIYTAPQKKEEMSEIEHLREIAMQAYPIFRMFLGLDATFFNAKEFRHLIDTAISLYLENWLDCDTTARKTTYAFAFDKFNPRVERDPRADPHDDRRKALDRAAEILNVMQELRTKQVQSDWAQLKETQESDGRNECDRSTGSEDITVQSPHKGPTYSFVELRTFDLYIDGNLYVFKMLAQRKEAMTSKADKGSYETLAGAYERYDRLFEDAKKLTSDKEYVVACMQIRKLESAYRFHLIAKLAKFIMDNQLQSSDIIEQAAVKDIWGRHLAPDLVRGYLEAAKSSKLEKLMSVPLIDEPYDIMYYNRKIAWAFVPEYDANKAISWRCMLVNILRFMLELCPPDKQASWTDADFSAAAQFFRNDYPVIESYVPMTVPQDRKTYFKNIQSIYKLLIEAEDSPLNVLRENIRDTVKSRNSKKTEK